MEITSREFIMRIFFVTLLFFIICPLTAVGFADEKSACLNSCTNDKRSHDMYCPPAGGFTDEENKQCLNKNSADLARCTANCSPPPQPEEPQPETMQSPPTLPDDPAPAENSINPAPDLKPY